MRSRFVGETKNTFPKTSPVSECEVDGNEVKSTTATSVKQFQENEKTEQEMLKVDLFKSMPNSDVMSLLSCLGIKTKNFKEEAVILDFEQKNSSLYIMLSGKAVVFKKNLLEEEEKIEELKTNDIFGHDFVCQGETKSPVKVIAKANSEVLILGYEKVIAPCHKVCPYHLLLIKNLISMIAKKNSVLNTKIDVVGKRFARERIMSFLKQLSNGETTFEIPYNREKMAEFLALERCSLSRELSNMQKEGLIVFKKSRFKINF